MRQMSDGLLDIMQLKDQLGAPCDIHITHNNEIYVNGVLLGDILRLDVSYTDINSDFFHTRVIKIDYSKVKKSFKKEQKQMKRADLLDI